MTVKKFNKKIGIISGLGAAAGARFYQMFIQESQAKGARYDHHYPEIVLYNIPSEGINEYGVCDESVLKRDVLRVISYLNSCHVDIILMACNSLHKYIKDFEKVTQSKIFNIIENVRNTYPKEVFGLLSTLSTRTDHLYNFASVFLNNPEQEIVTRAIAHLTNGAHIEQTRIQLQDIINTLHSRGATKVILGCTELPLAFDQLPKNVIDPGHEAIKSLFNSFWR